MNNEKHCAGIPARSSVGFNNASWKEGNRAESVGMLTSATGLIPDNRKFLASFSSGIVEPLAEMLPFMGIAAKLGGEPGRHRAPASQKGCVGTAHPVVRRHEVMPPTVVPEAKSSKLRLSRRACDGIYDFA